MRKIRDIEKVLKEKGFQEENTHHEMLWLYYRGKKTSIRTRFSHSAKQADAWLLNQIKKQVGLDSSDELDDLLDCPLTLEKYLALLISRGRITVGKGGGKGR